MSVGSGRRAVAIGGGTGLPLVLGCLLDLGFDTTAIVTVADDGGSSGVLREQFGILPPGDIRNCLVAMAEQPDDLLAQVFQYRFATGEGLAGHALGNLILAALTDITGDFASAIEAAGNHLRIRGRVLPSTLEFVELHGVDRTGAEVFGQARLAANPEPVERAYLSPSDPPAYAPALEAIGAADVVVVGPGSLYTSLIPNLLVAGVADALRASSAQRVYVCNVGNLRGETLGLDAADHVRALLDHGLEDALDIALVHAPCGAVCEDGSGVEEVMATPEVLERIEGFGVRVVAAQMADPGNPACHDRSSLCRLLGEVLA